MSNAHELAKLFRSRFEHLELNLNNPTIKGSFNSLYKQIFDPTPWHEDEAFELFREVVKNPNAFRVYPRDSNPNDKYHYVPYKYRTNDPNHYQKLAEELVKILDALEVKVESDLDESDDDNKISLR